MDDVVVVVEKAVVVVVEVMSHRCQVLYHRAPHVGHTEPPPNAPHPSAPCVA